MQKRWCVRMNIIMVPCLLEIISPLKCTISLRSLIIEFVILIIIDVHYLCNLLINYCVYLQDYNYQRSSKNIVYNGGGGSHVFNTVPVPPPPPPQSQQQSNSTTEPANFSGYTQTAIYHHPQVGVPPCPYSLILRCLIHNVCII